MRRFAPSPAASAFVPATIRARAPLRLAFGGGGTDVSPYADERGGLVLNATINRYAYVTLRPNETGVVTLRSLDYGESLSFPASDGVPEDSGAMTLACGVLRRLGILTDEPRQGFDLYTHTDCPPGSGLGASSTMVVTLIGAFEAWRRRGLDRYEVAQLAYSIEREDLGMQGGKQDQYAAAFGGFNFMEFERDRVLVNPLRIPDETLFELEYAMVLAYTGRSRVSSQILEQQISNFKTGVERSVAGMDRTKALAVEMKRALLTGDLGTFGGVLHEAWEAKKKMAASITNPQIESIYTAAREAGALGGKVSGAGGGGFMFFFADFGKRHAVIEAIAEHGAEPVHFGFTGRGLETWVR